MQPETLLNRTRSDIEADIFAEEIKYQKALHTGAEFVELKEIKQRIRCLKTELDWKMSFPLGNSQLSSLSKGFE